ncbi:hypothetical protein LVJ83_11720 [Uruburuella testudinis]|uniref:Solute:sodium symporter small subunit n=1 Tax=Uruburuella testudinis TaxID=1282863 RepID=A0ABY4DY11_9NEIS|nr:hypothetical protein [Uruburuella testudinis]UOO81576.1 hypothetical protein LVJ83_11720 [Uruburuella testudinis]
MIDESLRKLMVIDKARSRNRRITVKSWLIMMVTWSLWLYALYHLGDKYQVLLDRPFAGSWTFGDVLEAVSVLLLLQLNFLFVWSIMVQQRVKSMHQKR